MDKVKVILVEKNKSYKTINRKRKIKISFKESMENLESFIKLYLEGILPLVVVLNTDDEVIEQLTDNYYETVLFTDEKFKFYLLNLNKIKRDFIASSIFLDKFIFKDGNSKKINCIYLSDMVINPLNINLVDKRNRFKNSDDDYIIELALLSRKIVKEYLEEIKNRTLTKKEIEDIHKRDFVTVDESVKEWESLNLCAPGDAIGGAKDRCNIFKNNCHDCLVDYANLKKEHVSILNNLKLIKPYNEEKELIKRKIKKGENKK